ncbi:MAG: arylsulfatase [Novosphingobium sp.]|nr:arylsulfatase [Novosphingobium sp.]
MKSARLLATAAIAALIVPMAAVAQDRSILPMPRAPFDGKIAENVLDATPGTPQVVQAPEGAPNVFMFMSDDVGFAMTSAFGGPVPTPNFDRLAQNGQRYNRFHSTGICSPSRAALLTGRNHHNAGVGWLSDIGSPYPGYNGAIQPDTATVAQVLRLNGYNTAMFGKHHNVPGGDRSEAGPFDAWPTGLGFEYYYGFPQGDSDQFSPNMYRGVHRVPQSENDDRLVDQMLADDIIRYVHNQKAGNPDKPFLIYLSPGSTHAPHQARPEYIARFKGKYDAGWDAMRVEIWRKQIAMGIIPADTKLTPRSDQIPAWDSLTADQKKFHARQMEVAAAQMVFQDEQVGRVLDELERMGELDNTLVTLVLGDNGGSGENGPRGSLNELHGIHGFQERDEWRMTMMDEQGGPKTYQNYSVAWAWATNTPFRKVKQYSSFLGGIRQGTIISWPGHVKNPGSTCAQFGHVNDIVPTILDASNIPAPDMVLGTKQKPMDGQSLLSSLDICDAAKPRTQYFEITGKMGLYHNGWFLSGEDGRNSWTNIGAGGARPDVEWTLFDLTKDFSQSTDLSAKMPDKTQEMLALFKEEGRKNNVFPIDHRFGAARAGMMGFGGGRKSIDYWGKDVSVPAQGGTPYLAARSFTVDADLVLDSAKSSGAVVAVGSWFGGWSLYLDEGRPSFVWAKSVDPKDIYQVTSASTLPAGKSKLTMRFDAPKPGGPATVTLSSGGSEMAEVAVPMSVMMFAGGGETLDVGRDIGVAVTQYKTKQGAIEGDIPHVRVTID